MIALHGLSARAGAFTLRDVSAEVPRGGWAIVLGPAGAGKTTLLETIAGVRPIAAGRLELRGVDVTQQRAEARGVGIVYQRGFLFPHLGVRENVHYGARDAGHAEAVAERFGATALYGRPVRSLSGGERQLVALARALAPGPDILLLDEPFSALDPRGRARARRELQALRHEAGLTVVQVTHDFAEAGMLGDLTLLMEDGRVVQSGPPESVFRHPATSSAADFLGAENIFAGVVRIGARGEAGGPDSLLFDAGTLTLSVVGTTAAGPAHAVIRGEDVLLARDVGGGSARNVLHATVAEVTGVGVVRRVLLDAGGTPLVAVVTAAAAGELGLVPGASVVASIKATAIHLC